MKKLLLTLLISLNLAMPAHAFVAAFVVGGPMFIIYMSAGALNMVVSTATDNPSHSILSLISATLFDGEKNSENSTFKFNISEDIDTLITAGIYTQREGDTLKSELRALVSDVFEEKSISLDAEKLQYISPENAVATIQSEVGGSKLLANYFASKIGVQVQ